MNEKESEQMTVIIEELKDFLSLKTGDSWNGYAFGGSQDEKQADDKKINNKKIIKK